MSKRRKDAPVRRSSANLPVDADLPEPRIRPRVNLDIVQDCKALESAAERLEYARTTTPRGELAQLKFNDDRETRTRTATLNSTIVQRYYQLHDKLDYDIIEVPAGRDLARRKYYYDALKLLLDHGFTPDDVGPGEDDYGPQTITPVQLTAEIDDPEILQLLLDAGADPKSHYSGGTGRSSYSDVSGPPLQSAAANGSLAALESLISWPQKHSEGFRLSESDKADALLAAAYYILPDALEVLLGSAKSTAQWHPRTSILYIPYSESETSSRRYFPATPHVLAVPSQ
ncbi:hypothetical protein BJX64DRAFT_295235 [Aspergillus heterothallicus]